MSQVLPELGVYYFVSDDTSRPKAHERHSLAGDRKPGTGASKTRPKTPSYVLGVLDTLNISVLDSDAR